MKKSINLILIFFLPLLLSCKNDNEKIINTQNNVLSVTNTEEQLKDGINISSAFIENLEFNKYKYDGDYIENIKISSFDDSNFSKKFFQFLSSQNQAKQVFFIKLILVRIQQSDDIKSYQILSSVFNDTNLTYYLEDYELFLFQLFLYKPYFFIKGEYRYNQDQIIDYINQNLPTAFLINKEYFENNITDAQFPDNALLINQDVVNEFTIKDLKTNIEQDSKLIEVSFSPSFETGWKNEEKIYYNIYNYIDNILTKKLDKPELTLYSVKYKPFFKTYNIKGNSDYTIQDPDGYTNLRKDKNISSEILQKIKSGEKIDVLDNSGEWILIKTNEGKQGYVHKTRVKKKLEVKMQIYRYFIIIVLLMTYGCNKNSLETKNSKIPFTNSKKISINKIQDWKGEYQITTKAISNYNQKEIDILYSISLESEESAILSIGADQVQDYWCEGEYYLIKENGILKQPENVMKMMSMIFISNKKMVSIISKVNVF